jgi:hypothetical protein
MTDEEVYRTSTSFNSLELIEGRWQYTCSYPKESSCYTNDFELLDKDLCAIVLSPRICWDENTFFLLFIDKYLNIYPTHNIFGKYLDELEKKIGYNIIEKWLSYTESDHYTRIDCIIYPKEFEGKELFKKSFKLKCRNFFGFFLNKGFGFEINSELVEYIEDRNKLE